MRRRRALAAIAVPVMTVAVAVITPAAAQDRGAQHPVFAQALSPQTLQFPRDEGPHPDFRQEWWYLTGNLDSADGERFGFELTIFRFALSSPQKTEGSRWHTRQIYLGHFAVSDVEKQTFRFATKLSRGALGLAGAQADPFRVWVGNWQIRQAPVPAAADTVESAAKASTWQLEAAGNGYALSLAARPLMARVLNGERGLSRKSGEPGNATSYYSIPRIAVAGTLFRGGKALRVRGLAWLDREWGSGSLGPQEKGWDWFGLQLEDGSCVMFYSLRDRSGVQDPYSAGTWIDPEGHARPLQRSDVHIEVLGSWTDAAGARYPSRWRLVAPMLGLDLMVRPVLANQELVTSPRYWEGAVDVTGTRASRPVTGRGYVELVGYAGNAVGTTATR